MLKQLSMCIQKRKHHTYLLLRNKIPEIVMRSRLEGCYTVWIELHNRCHKDMLLQ